jgi:hypothetical protein
MAEFECDWLKRVIPSAPNDIEIVKEKSNVPAVVSVPLNTPFGLKVKPGGRLPPLAAKL